MIVKNKKNIFAAEDDFGNPVVNDDEGVIDTLDDISDAVDDLQDSVDDITEQEDTNIEIENNIENHFIAECESCGGIFISAVVESDNNAESIVGTCPICGKETTQDLNWIIKSALELEE
jgi:predicted transcriptional regulator